jgi:hypothetical protein
MKKSNANNRQVKRTRSWIFEALMTLMDEKPYSEITVSDIVEKAGIARQTFYRSYDNKDDVILQFFDKLFNPRLVTIENIFCEGGRGMVETTLPLGQIIKYAGVLKKILNTDAEHLCYTTSKKWDTFITGLYAEKMPKDKQIIFGYLVKYQNYGAMLLIIDWIKNDMPVPPETIIGLIRQMTSSFELAEHTLVDTASPHIVLSIQTENK